MFSCVNFMPPAKIPFHTFYSDRNWWPRNRKWRPFGVDWVPFCDKILFRKNERAQMLFQFLRSSLGSKLHLWRILQDVFPYFTFMSYWLTVNLNHYGFGLITSISAHLGTKDLRKKYGQPRLSPWVVRWATRLFAALNIAFSVESCHIRVSWCTESNVCICQDNAEKKSGSTLFKNERRFYTF